MGYIDPGLFGILGQIGAAFLLVVVTVFAFFSKSIKGFFNKLFKKGEGQGKDQPKE
jgi:hypothetical protein